MIFSYFVVFFSLFACSFGQESSLLGRVQSYTIDSNALGFNRTILVYTPPDYDSEKEDYPVIFFLHGFIGNHQTFSYIHDVIDRMISEGTLKKSIVVSPDGSLRGSVPPIGSLWANSVVNGRYQDFLIDEVIPWTNQNFRTKLDPKQRIIMGHSFGASAAVRLAVQYRDLFGSAASHSGFVKMDEWLVQYYVNVSVFQEFNATAVDDSFGLGRIFSFFIFTGAKAWSPNLSSPIQVDLPMYNNGSGLLDPVVVEKWESFSPHKIIEDSLSSLRSNPLSYLYVDIGDRDELELLQPNLAFAGELLSLDVPYILKVYSGPHRDDEILKVRFEESLSGWSSTVLVEDNSSKNDGTNLGLILGIVFGVVGFILLVGVIALIVIKVKWHVLFLEKKLVAENEDPL